MTLLQFLTALTNTNIKITLSEDDSEIITFVSGGTEGIEGDILAKTVVKITVVTTDTMQVKIRS